MDGIVLVVVAAFSGSLLSFCAVFSRFSGSLVLLGGAQLFFLAPCFTGLLPKAILLPTGSFLCSQRANTVRRLFFPCFNVLTDFFSG